MESHRHTHLPLSNGHAPVATQKQHSASKHSRNSPAADSPHRATDPRQQPGGLHGVSQYKSSYQRGHPGADRGRRDLQDDRRTNSSGSVSAGSRLSWAPQQPRDTQPRSSMHKDTLYRERRRSDSIGNDSQSGSWGHSPRQTVAADKIEGRMPQTRRIQHRNDEEGDESPSAVRIARRESISASVAVPRKIQPADIKRLTPPKPESGLLQVAAESSGQARPRLDLTLLEARIKALSASREERLQLAGNKQSPVPSPTVHSNFSALPAHSQPPKQPKVEIKADLMDHRRSLDLKGALSGPLDNARGVAEDDMTSTESRSSFEDSRSEDLQPRHFSAVQREIQSLHASLEESKLESLRLQQRLLEKLDHDRPQGKEYAISSSPRMEQGAQGNQENRARIRRRHEQPRPGSETHQDWPVSNVRRRNQPNRHHRHYEQFGATKESSASEASYSSSAARWRNRHVRRASNNSLQPRAYSHVNSSSDHSEYRFLETTAPPNRPLDVEQPTLFPKSTSMSRQRKGHIMSRLFRHCTKALIYFIIFSAIQVLLMGLLFRPTYTSNSHSTNDFQTVPKTVPFRGREYVADQRGFFTFLDAGFGTETLAYCHDLWAFTGDAQVLRQQHPRILHRVLDAVAHFGAVVVDTVTALVHERSTTLRV